MNDDMNVTLGDFVFFYRQGINSQTKEKYQYLDIGTLVNTKSSSAYTILRCNITNASDDELEEIIKFFKKIKTLRKKF
ncbi:hypothetical protein V7D15_07405 [Thermoanaerobacter thermohydrosulfuricus]